jgi:competence protein ComEC
VAYLALAVAALLAAGCSRPAESPRAGGAPAGPAGGKLQVWFINVGQGDSEFIRTPGGKTILVDGGRQVAGPVVLATLRRLGVQRLDWVVDSHPHEDHIGGLIDVLAALPAGQILDAGYRYSSPALVRYLRLIKERGYPFKKVEAGSTLDAEAGVHLEFLTPPSPYLQGTDSDPNNNSVVFRLTFGNVRLLFTGDMEEAERQWLYGQPTARWLPAEVLKAAHHGSHNGTDNEFLRRVRPRYAIISSGHEYGHPHTEALQALQQAGVAIYRTDKLGTIQVTTDGSRIEIAADHGTPAAPGAAGAAPAGAAPATAGGEVIGNRSTRVYHRPDCPALPRPENQVHFSSEAEAKRLGYRPHRACIGHE